MMLPVTRTSAEAHLYMDLHPCACGEARFQRRSTVVQLAGDLGSRYTGRCARCGRERCFEFRLSDEVVPPPATGVQFGGNQPSQLLDPGEWLVVADDHARRVPAGVPLAGAKLTGARHALHTAIAALEEVRKFAPAGAAEIPVTAFTNARGRAIRLAEPARFRLSSLDAVRAVYTERLAELDGR